MNNFTINGNWSIIAQNRGCKMLNQFASQNFTIMKFNPSIRQFVTIADVTQTLANFTINQTTRFSVSLECDRFSVDSLIFSILPPLNGTTPPPPSNSSNNTIPLQQFGLVPNNISNFTWTSSDDNLTIFAVGSSIWVLRLDLNNTFVKIYDTPVPLLPQNKLFATKTSIVVGGWNVTTAQVFAITFQNGSVFNCFNFTFNNYQNTPMIQVSKNMTKILIAGLAIPPNSTQVLPKIDMFTIDYRSLSARNITFPL
jgi:hypothetical protein